MNVVLAAMMSVAARVIVRGYIISSLPCGEEKSQNPSHALLEIIADNLSKAGFSWGCSLAIDSNVANGLDCRRTSQRRKAFCCARG